MGIKDATSFEQLREHKRDDSLKDYDNYGLGKMYHSPWKLNCDLRYTSKELKFTPSQIKERRKKGFFKHYDDLSTYGTNANSSLQSKYWMKPTRIPIQAWS